MLKTILRFLFLFIFLALFTLFGCSPLFYSPQPVSREARIDQLTNGTAPIEQPVTIYWNEYMVPFVEASNDQDAAFALGYVHSHLRLGQMELMRRISQGRISEMIGPFVSDIDYSLRILNFGRASTGIYENMPQETRDWLDSFVQGINWQIENSTNLPAEFRLLGFDRSPWTPQDVITISRLAGTDLSWLFYIQFLRMKDNPDLQEIWQDYIHHSSFSPVSFDSEPEQNLAQIFTHLSRSGSNTLVISGELSEGGSALIANDPHLGLNLPNIWLIAGVHTPTMNTVGFMIPGLPFFALGRNQNIAWGGTNMRAISSHLFKLDQSDQNNIQERTERIKRRWWFSRDVKVRDSEYGPILSDAPYFKSDDDIALWWLGHDPSGDEISAFLKVNRAKNWTEFRNAFESYAVSGQNMLYADESGNVGQILAYRQPLLSDPTQTLDLIKDSSLFTGESLNSLDQPFAFNPPRGFIASANNRPTQTGIPVSFRYAKPDRFERMNTLLDELGGNGKKASIEFIQRLQTDTFSEKSLEINQALLEVLNNLQDLNSDEKQLVRALGNWDGRYDPRSSGAAAYELLIGSLVPKLLSTYSEHEEIESYLSRSGAWTNLFDELWSQLDPGAQQALLKESLPTASKSYNQNRVWGSLHKLRLQHPLGNIPYIGRRFRLFEFGSAGSNDTLLKSGHPMSTKPHRVSYGANSRHVSDLSNKNENYFVLLGGQDGWLFSPSLTDQAPLFRGGQYIKVPLELEEIKKEFSLVQELTPHEH